MHNPFPHPAARHPASCWLRAFAAALLLGLPACGADTATSTAPAAPSTYVAPPNDMQFDTINATIKGKPFTLEIADTDAQRERGLMYRRSMAADHGMIFIFEVADNYRFWMKNTWIPLDIVFLDATGKVLEVQRREARDLTSMGPGEPSTYVLELNAGTAAAIGLSRGDHIDLPEKVLKRHLRPDEK